MASGEWTFHIKWLFLLKFAYFWNLSTSHSPLATSQATKSAFSILLIMKYFFLSCCFFLVSCYTTIPLTLYKDSYRDDSYKDREADEENEFSIVAKGNAITSMERVSDYAILRSAQLMEQEGFKYFVISKQIKDYSIEKQLNTQVVADQYGGYAATGVVDVRNPVVGLLVTGYNEEPALEDKGKNKMYKTDDVLKEFGHYVNEVQPKEFSLALTAINTTYVVLVVGSIGAIIYLLTL